MREPLLEEVGYSPPWELVRELTELGSLEAVVQLKGVAALGTQNWPDQHYRHPPDWGHSPWIWLALVQRRPGLEKLPFLHHPNHVNTAAPRSAAPGWPVDAGYPDPAE